MTDFDFSDIIDLRHYLHSIAEPSGQETKTAERILSFNRQFKTDTILTNLGGDGLALVYKGKSQGPCVLLRCELDALPIPESLDILHVSKNKNCSHKCGHDGHMAILAGVSKYLDQNPVKSGKVILLYQPAEEDGQGARRVLEDAAFNTINPDYVFALHNLPGFNKGGIILREGPFASASTGIIVELLGSTSHAGEPENGKSPALALADLIQSFSSIPQFHVNLSDAAKVTVIHARLGEEAFGTSPGYGRVCATLRAHSNEILELLLKTCNQLAENTANTYGLDVEIKTTEEFPATVNDIEATKIVEDVVDISGLDKTFLPTPFPWSEDFGHFTSRYKGALFGLGSGVDHLPLHNPGYDFPDDIIPSGVKIFTGIIDRILNT